MNRLNDAPILDQTDGQTEKLLMIALWKLAGSKTVTITADDMSAFTAHHKGMGVLFMHGHKDSIDLSVIDAEAAQRIALHQATQQPKGTH